MFPRPTTGIFATLDVASEELTYPACINKAGDVAGECSDGNGFHAFIRTRGLQQRSKSG